MIAGLVRAFLSVFLTAVVTTFSSDSACRDKSRSHFKRLALFSLDARKTVLSTLACLCVGHSEHIVGLHSAVNTAIARNRCA